MIAAMTALFPRIFYGGAAREAARREVAERRPMWVPPYYNPQYIYKRSR